MAVYRLHLCSARSLLAFVILHMLPSCISVKNIWQCKYLMYCIFSILKPLTCGRQSRCPGWAYKLPGGQKFSFKLSRPSVGLPQRTPSNLIKRPRFINSPGVRFIKTILCAAHKQPFLCYASSFCTVKICLLYFIGAVPFGTCLRPTQGLQDDKDSLQPCFGK